MPGFHRSVAIDLFEQTSVRRRYRSFARENVSTRCLKKVGHFYYYDKFGNSGPIFMFFFTAKFKKNLRSKVKLKLPPPPKSVSALPGETLSGQSIQLYIHISENINASC